MRRFVLICSLVLALYVWRVDSFTTAFWTLVLIGLVALVLECVFDILSMIDRLLEIARTPRDDNSIMYPQEHRDPTRPRYRENGVHEAAGVWNHQQHRNGGSNAHP